MAAAVTTSAPTLEGQALEVARELQTLEAAQELNNVAIQPDIENNTVTITMVIPTTLAGSGGNVQIAAAEYLS